jgi:hypothetical protein
MLIEETRDQARSILDKNGVKTISASSANLFISASKPKFLLLDVVDCEGPDVIELINYDDYNRYQEEGFYIAELNKIDHQVKNSISIKSITEHWDDKGNVTLSFQINDEPQVLKFNHLEEKDNVPLPFVDYVNQLLTNYEGSSKFILVREEHADLYVLLPNAAIESLNSVDGINTARLGFDGTIHDSEYEFENEMESQSSAEDDYQIINGASVRHSKFGDGVILLQEGQGASARVQVNFQETGLKWLVLQYANLEFI